MISKNTVILWASILVHGGLAHADEPSLCTPAERAYFNGPFVSSSKKGNSPTKLLSLCADSTQPPGSLTYRFGQPGKTELEFSAPRDGTFFSTGQTLSPRANLDVLYFSRGAFTYALTACVGGECPADFQLLVFRGGKTMARFHSIIGETGWGGFEITSDSLIRPQDSALDFE